MLLEDSRATLQVYNNMYLATVTVYILLSLRVSSETIYQEGECNGIYDHDDLQNWALFS